MNAWQPMDECLVLRIGTRRYVQVHCAGSAPPPGWAVFEYPDDDTVGERIAGLFGWNVTLLDGLRHAGIDPADVQQVGHRPTPAGIDFDSLPDPGTVIGAMEPAMVLSERRSGWHSVLGSRRLS